MGYVKIQKGTGAQGDLPFTAAFDLVCADNIGDVKRDLATGLVVHYLAGKTVTLLCGGDFDWVESDLVKLMDALDVMNGASGVAPMTKLSVPLKSSTMKNFVNPS